MKPIYFFLFLLHLHIFQIAIAQDSSALHPQSLSPARKTYLLDSGILSVTGPSAHAFIQGSCSFGYLPNLYKKLKNLTADFEFQTNENGYRVKFTNIKEMPSTTIDNSEWIAWAVYCKPS